MFCRELAEHAKSLTERILQVFHSCFSGRFQFRATRRQAQDISGMQTTRQLVGGYACGYRRKLAFSL